MNEKGSYGAVWLGDLLDALAQTTVSDDVTSVRWAVEMMGLDPRFATFASKKDPNLFTDPTPPEPDDSAPILDEQPIDVVTPQPVEVPAGPVPYDIVRTHSVSPKVGAVPAWYENADDLDDVDEAQLDIRPELRPLFPPGTTRALLSTALATPNGEGEIDLDRVIEVITRLQPLTTLPRERHATMRLGVQLLIDRGEGLLPFHADQELLFETIHEVVGRDRVAALYFDDSPLRKMNEGDRYGRQFAYQPPTPGTPVVMLTDLGLAGRRSRAFGASQAEWLRFAEIVRGAECPLLALTPYGPKRTPRRLRDAMYILPWDRVTNVSLVRRTVGHGLELARLS